jgi:predicted ATP-grasp superfamily ATP-dependent carboligase
VSVAGTLVESGRPILTVFASGANVVEIESRLQEQVAALEKKVYIA